MPQLDLNIFFDNLILFNILLVVYMYLIFLIIIPNAYYKIKKNNRIFFQNIQLDSFSSVFLLKFLKK